MLCYSKKKHLKKRERSKITHPEWVVITGMMGVGKTTVAEHLGKQLKLPVWDHDTLIEKKTHRSIPQLFKDYGVHGFRRWERIMFRKVYENQYGILSTGGGLLSQRYTRQYLAKSGNYVEIWLTASIDWLLRNTAQSGVRPLLDGEDRRKVLQQIAQRRFWCYNMASIHTPVENISPPKIATGIAKAIRLGSCRRPGRVRVPFRRMRRSHFTR